MAQRKVRYLLLTFVALTIGATALAVRARVKDKPLNPYLQHKGGKTATVGKQSSLEDTTIVVVEEGGNGAPIAGARVAFSSWVGSLEKLTDDSGAVRVDLKGQFSLRITAKGFVGIQTTASFASGLIRFALPRTGGITFKFVDDQGKPVAGVGVLLQPTSSQLALLSEGIPTLNKESDHEGCVSWSELPPHGRYLWQSLTDHVLLPDGMVERGGPRTVQDASGSVTIQDDGSSPFYYGGAFAIESGKFVNATVKVKQAAVIRGKVSGLRDPTVVHVMLREILMGDSGSFVRYHYEKGQVTGPEGAFLIKGLRPGSKVIKVHWRDDQGVFQFATHSCQITSGQDYDAGTLYPRDGLTISFELAFEPMEILRGIAPNKLRAEVRIHNSPPGKDSAILDTILSETIEIQAGVPVSVSGLVAGFLQVTCSPRVVLDGNMEPIEFESPRPFETTLPGTDRVQLKVTAKQKARVVVRCPITSTLNSQIFQAVLIPIGSGTIQRLGSKVASPGRSEIEIEGQAVNGEYDVIVVSKTGLASAYGRGRLTVVNGVVNVVEVSTEEGATVRGRAYARDGTPFKHDVHLTLDGASSGELTSMYQAKPNEKGEFQLDGVVPGMRLKSALFVESILVGSAGTVTVVELREKH